MKLPAILVTLVYLVGSVVFGMTRDQAALLADLSDYHHDIASFEKAAAQAVRGGIPDCLVTLRRYYCLLQQGELAPMKVAMAHVEKVKAELLEQKFDPVDAGILEDTLEIGRKLVARAETDPAGAEEIVTEARGKAEATAHMRDLRLIDSAINQYAIEHNKRGGDPVPVEWWTQYLPRNQRLRRTAADCLGNPYGPQVVDQLPKVSRKAYERISGSVPKEFFKPYGVAEK